jgi:hypothetical protein
MVHDMDPKGGGQRWWVLGRAYTALWRVFLLAFAGFSVFHVIDPFHAQKAEFLRFAVLAVIFCLLSGRLLVVAICVEDDAILLRRLFPGWVERVPISRLAYGINYQLRAPARGVLGESVILLGWPIMPTVIQGTYRTASDGTRGDAKEDWAALVSCLRDLFEARGRWKVVASRFGIGP